jgi:transposase
VSVVLGWYRRHREKGLRHGQAVKRVAHRIGVDYSTAARVVKRAEAAERGGEERAA